MGGSLSKQEDLFVSQRWADLLAEAMSTDVDLASGSGGTEGPRGGKDGAAFRMSFNEWQAFLGILEAGKSNSRTGKGSAGASHGRGAPAPDTGMASDELRRAGSAPSAICGRLSPQQLNCPLVSLAVHAFGLWSGAIDSAMFRARLEALCELVMANEDAEAMERLESSCSRSAGEEEGDDRDSTPVGSVASDNKEDYYGSSTDEDGADGDDPPLPPPAAATAVLSRRRRLFNALKDRVRSNNPSGGGSGGGGAAADSHHPQERRKLFLVEDYIELEHLFRNLVNERISKSATGTGAPAAEDAAAPFHAADSPAMVAAFKALKRADGGDRPVARVALCIGLSIYAALAPTPLYAVEGVTQLRRLDQAMQSGAKGSGNIKDASATDEVTAVSGGGADPVTLTWPWVACLEAALVQRQHELDVAQCRSADGQGLAAELRRLRDSRCATDAAAKQGGTTADGGAFRERFAGMSPAERWQYCMSQYIGQRHIWAPLMTHFLSADVFEADKPTVMIFFGPSGYGKSELAKQVASAVHGVPAKDLETTGKMVYIHMPSFATKESIYSLIDPPAAHVGDGILLSALHANPDAVIVLDEFEKSTAEAVQNVWLSAFQKNGVLRSLKRADRSISTVRATFILTCNIAADTIDAEAARYLAGSAAQQVAMRARYDESCRGVCRLSLGDPFVNRVHGFFPFVPYTLEERQGYVEMVLERLLAGQLARGRRVRATPRCVAALAAKVRTFHAATIEEVLRPLLVDMAREEWAEAVLTVEARAVELGAGSGVRYVLLPCRRQSGAGPVTAREDVWERLPGGAECLREWEEQEGEERGVKAPEQQQVQQQQHKLLAAATAATLETDVIVKSSDAADNPSSSPAPAAAAVTGEKELQLLTEHDLVRLTEREQSLVTELQLARELLVWKDLEIATLKEKVLMLQKLLALMVCVSLCFAAGLYLLVGLKLTIVLVTGVVAFATLVLKIPLRIILEALGAFFRFLGPGKSAILVLLLSVWLYQVNKGYRC